MSDNCINSIYYFSEDFCLSEKEFDRIEKTRSDAADDGWTSSISLKALAQF